VRSGDGHRLSPELRLLADCCRSCFLSRSEKDASFDTGTVAWDRLLDLARFHRIEGLVWTGLAASDAAVPQPVAEELRTAAASIAANNLRAALECRHLLADFERARVPLLFLKGLTLGALAYRNPSLKSGIDIDLLVAPADLSRASQLLLARGYQLDIPRDVSALHRWHRRAKESVWVKASPQLQIDLHTRTADTRWLIPSIDVHSPAQLVDVGSGIRLPTLADEQLFTYLAVHGAWSAWYRLKWIADFAAFVERCGPDSVARLHQRSSELGGGRSAGQALLLADRLFGTLGRVPALRQTLERDGPTRALADAALRMLAAERGEPTERRFGTLPIHLLEFRLVPGGRYRLSEIARRAAKLIAPRG
jgi:hypothetical protein